MNYPYTVVAWEYWHRTGIWYSTCLHTGTETMHLPPQIGWIPRSVSPSPTLSRHPLQAWGWGTPWCPTTRDPECDLEIGCAASVATTTTQAEKNVINVPKTRPTKNNRNINRCGVSDTGGWVEWWWVSVMVFSFLCLFLSLERCLWDRYHLCFSKT